MVALMTLASADATGAGQMALEFCRSLGEADWRVVLVSGPAPPPDRGGSILPRMVEAGVEVRELDRLVAPTWPVWKRLRTIAAECHPDVVIGVMQRDRPVALVLARVLRVPGLVAVQNQHVFWGPPPVRWAKRLIYRLSVRFLATLAVCASEPVLQEIRRFGVSTERSRLLPNGIRIAPPAWLSESERRTLRAELGAGPADLLMVNVGRLDRQKGQDLLISALARCSDRYPRLRLALVGGVVPGAGQARGAEFAAGLKRQVSSEGVQDRVVFAGWRTDVARVLRAADGYVHAARWEGWSLAVMEAMANSLPIVMTDCAGWPTGFSAGTQGWVVASNDVAALAVGIEMLAKASDTHRVAMGEASRSLVQRHYDIRTISHQFARLVVALSEEGRR